MCAQGETGLLQRGGDVDGVLGGDGGDGDELTAALRDEARELGPDVGVAELCACEEAVELDPGLLEHAETGFGLVAGLLCALSAVLALQDRLARRLGELGFGGRARGRAGRGAVCGRLDC